MSRKLAPVLSPEDHLAIQRLYAEYNHAIHRGDGVAWAACFTQEGEFSNRQESVVGREALAAYATEFAKNRDSRYWIGNLVLEAAPAGATGYCYLLIVRIAKGGKLPRISLSGIYTDELVRITGEWRFARRHIARDL